MVEDPNTGILSSSTTGEMLHLEECRRRAMIRFSDPHQSRHGRTVTGRSTKQAPLTQHLWIFQLRMNPRTAKEFPEYFESKDYGSRVCRLVLKKKKEDAIVPLTFVFCGMQGTMQLYPKEVFYLLSHEGTYDIYDGGLPMTVSGDAVQSYNMVKTSNVASKGFSSMTLV
ncbi:unnamed protein product [Fusarium graminearum]|uniref:Uncharacterized protein n=1 Tax=Gibberella zeae TaxID=5518 RepID=A0A4U9F0W5_GIBZA|nr:unnamed protein product [Fusarium graminearum]CAF3538524.1 unnamed protein product [Fusarium graminearum]CAF3653658.1 unnamed protein product [Fusarium graminearum]CAG1998921.1 unnamed protein product [Fusarium graminearum]VTO89634.1 unnamed protein product [Fusarium graminearum]